jgi:CBS domain-containing protein
MNVENILMQKGTDVATIEPEASIKKAAHLLSERNIGALVVARDDALGRRKTISPA